MKCIYIAGHTGFLGRSLVNEFINDKKYKVLIPNRDTLDLVDQKKTLNFFKKNKIDYVINAAGLVGGIKKNIENQIDFLDINFRIQSNVLKAAHQNNVEKFINVASSCIYPKNHKQPLKEDYLFNGSFEPTNEGYALAKVCGLKLAEFYKKKFNFNSKTCIPCNIYGIGDKFFDDSSHFVAGIISKIYNAKINNEKFVKLWGTGNPRREIMFNSEVARAIKFCLERKINEQNINIGTGIDFMIKEYAIKIKRLLKYEGKILWDKEQPDGIKSKLLDISILKKYKFKHKVNIDEGLKIVIEDFIKKIKV